MQQRILAEMVRSRQFGRPLTLVCLELLGEPVDRPIVAAALGGHLTRLDFAAWHGPSRLLVLLPECGLPGSLERARRLLTALQAVCPLRGGHATFPSDAADDYTLVSLVLRATQKAQPGQVAVAADALPELLQIGDRTILVASPIMVELFERVRRIAKSRMPVLIEGETGVGKDIVANAVHTFSNRPGQFVAINCAALPEPLVEGELFGTERGAFTGADRKSGLFEMARGGTVFLDEVGELPLGVQAKLLRALELGKTRRLGGTTEVSIDVRFVAATNRNLEQEVRAHRLREDLYFRLSVARLLVPPLRARRDELPPLAQKLLDEECARLDRTPMTISATAMQRLLSYAWPGNIRQLINTLALLAATEAGPVIDAGNLPPELRGQPTGTGLPREPTPSTDQPPDFLPLDEEIARLERRRIIEALEATAGNQSRAAKLLKLPERTFYYKLKKYSILPRRRAVEDRTA